ncbi:MAG: patatin-like phospholipase family protein [Ruminococcus sp.]|jgi:NTE family protein|nr:patatin-like phospholipase family protein [Ruminococcus sp.]MBQ1380531.1 patatin-like phospholipase family protein [Ruminococcus sp.]MBQ1601241.1 patatin-like phospholipase family protein [Ruminococcus sp.]MBQ1638729.1 patatin-like phospholipase family protein [Ruminococcus sp.]MBQ1806140.1 patatin-like phospholipase family protein [Ruminococcus sp.]
MKEIDREKRKNELGVVFSGGGLQGIAHIGAVRALYELGLRPQYVAGTSSGSAMAALTAMGCTPDEMQDFAEHYWETLADFRPIPIVAQLASLKFNKSTDKDGLKDGAVISNVIRKAMDNKGVRGFQNLPINLSICTNDTYTTDECIFTTLDEGLQTDHIHYICGAPLELAVRASMTFPGIYTTCNYQGYNFIDGGSKDNLPTKIMRDMGVGKVLALAFDITDYTPETGLDGMMKVVWRALDLYSINSTRESKKLADYVVDIKNSKTAIFSMDNLTQTIREGYDCVMRCKDDLLRIFG